jgi:hypothetical protein
MTSQANVYGTDMIGGNGMINPMMLMGNQNGMNIGGTEGSNDFANYQAMMMMMLQQQQQQQRGFSGDGGNQM